MEISFRKKGVYAVHVIEEQDLFFETVEKLGIDADRYKKIQYTWPDMTCLFAVDTKKKMLEYIGQPSICAAIVSSGVKLWSVKEFIEKVSNGCVQKPKYRFYKENETDKVWWLDNYDVEGEHIFSFDRKKKYNLFADYPHKLSVQEWMTFNAENEFWKDFFRDRNEEYEFEHALEIYDLAHK